MIISTGDQLDHEIILMKYGHNLLKMISKEDSVLGALRIH